MRGAGCDFGGDGLGQSVQGAGCGGVESGDYGGAGEDVGVCEVGPLGDLEGPAGVLGLDCACKVGGLCVSKVRLYMAKSFWVVGVRTAYISKFAILEE